MSLYFLFKEKRSILIFQLILSLNIVFLSLPTYSQQVLSLSDALEYAKAHSPTLQKFKHNLNASKQQLVAQRASLKSNISLEITPIQFDRRTNFNSNFSRWISTENSNIVGALNVSQPILFTDGQISLTNEFAWQQNTSDLNNDNDFSGFNNNVFFSYRQPLFTFNRTKLTLKEVEVDLNQSELNFIVEQLTLEQQITSTFYKLFELKSAIEISREELKNSEENLALTKNKVDGGLLAEVELYQAELNAATRKASLLDQQNNYDNEVDRFKLLLGLPLDEKLVIQVDSVHRPVEIDLNDAIKYALNHRKELEQRKLEIDQTEILLKRSKSVNEFRADLEFRVGLLGENEEFNEVLDRPRNNQFYGITFSVPIWDWGERKARLKSALLNVENSRLDYEIEKSNVEIELRKAYRQLKNQESIIKLERANLKNAQLTYEINLEKYENASLTSFDLNNYQTQLIQKRQALAKALVDYRVYVLNMKLLTLYDFEKDVPLLPESR